MTTVSVVTGAGGGMGLACARALASAADVVLLTDINEEKLAAAAPLVAAAKVDTIVGNLGDATFVAELAARAAALGELRSLVHCAGLSPNMAGWREILRIDLTATAQLLDAFLPHVRSSSAAVCLASIAGHMGAFDPAMDAVLDDPLAIDLEARYQSLAGDDPDPGATYRLAKRAVIRLCERAAVAWGAHGGRVVSLSPGLIDTDMGRLELVHNPIKTWMAQITPVGGERTGPDTVLPGLVDDIANTVAFLCSDRAAFLSGCDVRVDGGLVGAMNNNPPQ